MGNSTRADDQVDQDQQRHCGTNNGEDRAEDSVEQNKGAPALKVCGVAKESTGEPPERVS